MTPPIVGLDSFVNAVDDLCANSSLYQHREFPILAMDLLPGWGQTTALQYLSGHLSRHMEPAYPWSQTKEYRLTGTQEHLIHCFLDLHSSSATFNFFHGCVAWDLSSLTGSPTFSQAAQDFPAELKHLGRSACNLLFLPGENTPLTRHLEKTLPQLQFIHAAPYTPRQLAQIGLLQLQQDGVQIPQAGQMEELLVQQVRSAGAASPRDVCRLTRTLLFAARRSESGLVLSADALAVFPGPAANKGA